MKITSFIAWYLAVGSVLTLYVFVNKYEKFKKFNYIQMFFGFVMMVCAYPLFITIAWNWSKKR